MSERLRVAVTFFLLSVSLLGLPAGGGTAPVESGAARPRGPLGPVRTDAPLVLLDTVPVGGEPESMVVDCWGGRNDLLFWDLSGGKVRFLDGDTLALATEEIELDSWSFDGWMVYDHTRRWTYVLQLVLEGEWTDVRVHPVVSRFALPSFSANAAFNDPTPQDSIYDVDGLAFKEPGSEGDNRGRLLIDNTVGGHVDVVDLDRWGTGLAQTQRFFYRLPIGGSWQFNFGNSLALESRHETRPVDDLASTDLLYIADANHLYQDGCGYIRVWQLNQTGALGATALPEVNLNDTWPFANGMEGITMAGPRDRLIVASGKQSFDDGYVAELDTTDNQLEQVITLLYGDRFSVLVDWYDPRRAFVATFDGWYNDPYQALYLHLIYDGVVVDTLRLQDQHEEGTLRGMAFDPYHRRLYLSVGETIMVVGVNYGAGSPPAPRPPVITISAVIPWYGGSLDAPDGSVEMDFGYQWVSQSTAVTYTTQVESPPPVGDAYPVRLFDLSAADPQTGTPVTGFDKPLQLTINYAIDRGAAVESTLDLYWWDGDEWLPEPSASLEVDNDRITAALDHASVFAVLGETRRVFMPAVLRGS